MARWQGKFRDLNNPNRFWHCIVEADDPETADDRVGQRFSQWSPDGEWELESIDRLGPYMLVSPPSATTDL